MTPIEAIADELRMLPEQKQAEILAEFVNKQKRCQWLKRLHEIVSQAND